MRFLVDTNIWIRLLQKHRTVKNRLEAALTSGDDILVSPVVYYELLRGLEKRDDRKSIEFVRRLWSTLLYVEMSKPIWDEAVRMWVASVRANRRRSDADVLIAAAASHLGAVVVTHNVQDFVSLGVGVDNWVA